MFMLTPSLLPIMAKERMLDEEGRPVVSREPGSVGAARVDDEDEIARVARKSDELCEILMTE